MCCFSPVSAPLSWLSRLLPQRPLQVFGTRIFARMDGDRQALVYSMTLSVRGDVAMILPLPVAPGVGEDGIEFVDLHGYAEFFDDLNSCFFVPQPAAAKGGFVPRGGPSLPRLTVHAVGSFEASFVPSIGDFSRLDPRFRIRDEVWQALPLYADYGFAVFKLKKGRKATIHPMAFRFPTRAPGALFFPTVHVHDEAVHATADFDHRLFYQGAAGDFMFQGKARSERSFMPARSGIRMEKAKGLVDGEEQVMAVSAVGELKNEDTWIPL
jgi:hypothetical protein